MSENVAVVIGRVGTRKTTAAGEISDRIEGTHVDTDTTRLSGVIPLASRTEARYDAPENRATYALLAVKAVSALERGLTPVLEGSFSNITEETSSWSHWQAGPGKPTHASFMWSAIRKRHAEGYRNGTTGNALRRPPPTHTMK